MRLPSLLFLFSFSLLYSDNFYVATTGSDNASCSVSNPCANIQTAINLTSNGDVVIVSGGTYLENLLIETGITLKSADETDPAIIDGSSPETDPALWNGGSCIVIRTPSGASSRVTATVQDITMTGGKGTDIIEDSNHNGSFSDPEDEVKKVGGGMILHKAGLTSRRNNIINNGDYSTKEGGAVYAAGTGADIPDDQPADPPDDHFPNERLVIEFEETIFTDNNAQIGHTVMVNGWDPENQFIDMDFGDSQFDCAFDSDNNELDGVSEYWVKGKDNAAFDFTGGISSEIPAITTDVWVDPVIGVDEDNLTGNEGNPFLTIDYAMSMIYPTEDNPITIYLMAGTFSPSTESFPITMLSYVVLDGEGQDTTALDGGGIGRVLFYDHAYETMVRDLTIQNGNTPADDLVYPGLGGGILSMYSDVELININISNNVALEHGGGFMLDKSKLKMSNSIISDNISYGSGGGGHVSDFEAEFFDVVIRDNVAGVGGGLVLNANSIFENVIIENNINEYVDNYTAGGLYLNGEHQINNSVISSNHGGAIHAAVGADIKIINSIINDNDSSWEITINGTWNSSSSTQLLIAHSNLLGGMDAIQFGMFTSTDDVVWLEGNIDQNPMFTGNGDFSLQENSPCIDAGTAYLEYEGEILVNISEDMYVDGNNDGISYPDIGAIEWYPEVFGCMDEFACNHDNEANVDDGSCEYSEENYDCQGNCMVDVDCMGVCGGDASYDYCGICDGDDSSCLLLGDMNYDGLINVIDIVMAVDLVLENVYDEVADVNEDGQLNVLDIVMLVDWVLNGLPNLVGCSDESACNYDSGVEIDDGSCEYPEENYDCEGDCLIDMDCAGICGGDNSTAESCCGLPVNEDCTSDCHIDDDDVCCTLSEIDECGMCFGNGSSCSPTITDIDGNVYGTVQIGGQLWITENLKVTRYNNGDVIPTGYSNDDWINLDLTATGAYSVFEVIDEENNDCGDDCSEVYGNLYNWYAVNDDRGLCPEGFHVPSDHEYQILEIYLGMDEEEANSPLWRGTDEGGKLKEVGYQHWLYPNTGATNVTGFTLLGSGQRNRVGTYDAIDIYNYSWTSTDCNSWNGESPGCMDTDACNYDEEVTVDDGSCVYTFMCYNSDECQAWYRGINYAGSSIIRQEQDRVSGYSVRCVEN